jgi:integrase
VDLQHGHIDIVWSKGNRSRRLPVTPQVARVLDACDQQSRARFPGRANFFVSGTGSKVSPGTPDASTSPSTTSTASTSKHG